MFVPLKDIYSVWDELKEQIDSCFDPIVQWFEGTYLGKNLVIFLNNCF